MPLDLAAQLPEAGPPELLRLGRGLPLGRGLVETAEQLAVPRGAQVLGGDREVTEDDGTVKNDQPGVS